MTKQKDIKQAYNMEPEEIVKYFDSKGLKTSYNWREVWQEAHAKAFTVAKMTDTALLKDTQTMLKTALKEGWSEGKFKKNASELFEKRGWVGFKEVTNPRTGKKETVELGTPRRIVNIFRTNMRTAYAAGRYKEQLEDVDIAPYLQYVCVLDERTRPEHRAMHGKVFRYDDPFWSVFYPPNGWGCRCHVESLTEEDIKSGGVKVESSAGRLTSREVTVNPETGEKKTISGIRVQDSAGNIRTMETDAGWNSNPGKDSWNLDVLAYKKILECDPDIQAKFISEMAQNPHQKKLIDNLIDTTIKNGYKTKGIEKTLTWFTPEIIGALEKEKIRLQTPIVVFEDRQVRHSLDKGKAEKQKLTEAQFKRVPEFILNPDEIYIDTTDHGVIYVKYLSEDEIIDGRNIIKIPVNINSTRTDRPINYVGTSSRIPLINIQRDRRYKKIE